VLGSLTGRLVSTGLALLWHRHRLAWPAPLSSIAGPVTYGSHVLGAGLAWYAFRNADLTIIGKVLGKNPLGAYTIGWNLASVPVDRISQLLGRTAPPVLAKVQTDPSALRRYVLLLTEGVAALTFPLAIGLALVAPNFVATVLGDKWQPATRALQILSLSACFRSIQPLLNLVLLATGQSRRAMEANIIQVGARGGIEGVALVWLVGYPLVAALFYVRHAFAVCDLGYGQYLRSLWPALSGCLVMALVVLVMQYWLPTTWPLGLDLWLQCAVGAVAYGAALLAFHRPRVHTFLSAVRGF
jgi:PST family polysaccharide transporter